MEMLIQLGSFFSMHGLEILGALTTVLSGLIVIFTFIPGEQPEKALKACLDFITKFSVK